MRLALAVAAVLLVAGVAWTLVGNAADPPSPSCAAELEQAACDAAVSAVMRRGMDRLHPLILAAHVEPGSAPGATELGHRATVIFDLLLVPGPTEVELYYDQGSHWGGEVDRSDTELAAYAVAPVIGAALLAAVIVGLALRRRRAARG